MILAVISLVLAIRGHKKVEAKLAEQEKLFEEVIKE